MATGHPPRTTGKARIRTTPMIGRKLDMLGPPAKKRLPEPLSDKRRSRPMPSGPQHQLPPRPGDSLVVGAPCAAPMTRQAQRRHEHQVESEVETGEVGSLEQKGFGGAGNPPSLARRQRRRRGGELSSRLDLDDREHLAAARQNVDLAGRTAPAARQDMPATQPQMPEAEPLRHPPAALRASASQRTLPPDLPHPFSLRMARARR